MKSPKITKLNWGSIEVENCTTQFRDVKLFPGGASEWNWKETGTEHTPGIQETDLNELIEHNAEIIVLSRGYYGRLGVSKSTLSLLKELGITVHILKTKEAVKLYNELAETSRVGALIHTTC